MNTCISPPELDETRLLAYLEADADLETQDHLARCAYCEARANELKRLQNSLRSLLFRADCPSPLLLAEYQEGMVLGSEAVKLQSHLLSCHQCSEELKQLDAFHRAFQPVESTMKAPSGLRVLVARILGKQEDTAGGRIPLSPALSGLRGPTEPPQIFQVDDLSIALETRPDPDAPGKKVLLGLVSGLESQGVVVAVFDDHEFLMETEMDAGGNFVLSMIEAGEFSIVLRSDELEIHLPGVMIP